MGRRQDRQVWRGQSFELVLLRLSLGREISNIFACNKSEAIGILTSWYIVCQLICFALLLHFCTYQVDTISDFVSRLCACVSSKLFKTQKEWCSLVWRVEKSSAHIRWLGSSKATSGGDRWRTGTVLSSGSYPARKRPQCACNIFTEYFSHTSHLTNQRKIFP